MGHSTTAGNLFEHVPLPLISGSSKVTIMSENDPAITEDALVKIGATPNN